MPRTSNTAVVTDDQDRVLLIYWHRFIWEVPGGWGGPGEQTPDTIRREVEEETGWHPGEVTLVSDYNAMSGISDAHFSVFHVTGAVHVGEPEDKAEASRVEWVPLDVARKHAAEGEISDGPSLAALTYFLGIYRAVSEPRGRRVRIDGPPSVCRCSPSGPAAESMDADDSTACHGGTS